MSSSHTLNAVFTQNTYTLAVTTSGQGSVAKVPDQATYASGSSVQLTATPSTGWSFSGWSGGTSGTANPLTIVMNDNKAVTATFTQNVYTLTVTVNPTGGGTVTRSNNGPYHLNDVVTLTEAPSAGYTFSGWSGDGTGSGTTRTVTVTGNMAATATFTQNQYQVVFATSGSGATSPSGTQTYAAGAVVPISATAGSGYTFSSWSATGSIVIASASSASTTATINGAGTITAAFTQIQYTLAVTVSPTAGGTVTPDKSPPYHLNDVITLTEAPNSGYAFSGWSGDGTGTGATRTVTITGNMAVTATFTQIQYTLGIYSDSACTTPKTDISWGDIEPGGSTHQTVYIKNTGNVAATLSCTFGNWVPSGAASYITVTWDKEGAPIAPNESVAATFTLTVSPSITGITTFSVEINIIATQA
jgi:uncharacterized repeat protein (TIGR02543 family)